MKACGIIVEYNPFHNGHQYPIEQGARAHGLRRAGRGDVGQFLCGGGEPAILDKWKRAEASLKHSASIWSSNCPYPWVVQSASHFAHGAVTPAEAGRGIIAGLWFGNQQSGGTEGNRVDADQSRSSERIDGDRTGVSQGLRSVGPKSLTIS